MAKELSAPVYVRGYEGRGIFLFRADDQIVAVGSPPAPAGLFVGTLKAEGGGFLGNIYLLNSSGEEGAEKLDGNGHLLLGVSKQNGGGYAGHIHVRNAAGLDGIVIDGSKGFRVNDSGGDVVLNFAAEVNLPIKTAGLSGWGATRRQALILVSRAYSSCAIMLAKTVLFSTRTKAFG